LLFFYVSLPQSNHHCCLREDDDATRPETFGMMRNAMAPATMLRHKKQRNGKMHNAAAPKNVVAQIAVLPHTQKRYCTMLQHTMHMAPCRGISYNAVAQKTAPWHEAQCRGTKKTALAAHCQCHGTKKASRHDHGTKSSTWRNATANCGRPWHKAQCHSTNHIAAGIKHIAAAQKVATAHKNRCGTKNGRSTKEMRSGTKQNATAHKTTLRHKNSTAECRGCMRKATAKKTKTPPTTTTAEATAQVDCFFHS